MSDSSGSVTLLIHQLKAGNEDAAQLVWERFFTHLVQVARKRCAGIPRRAADEEDVALSAFDSFCRRHVRGEFDLQNRDDLWRLLVLITVRKAADAVQHESRLKRGGGRVVGESGLFSAAGEPDIGQVIG